MYLLYVDASGTPDQQDATKHYVLVGISVHEGTWFALDRRIQGLKRTYSIPGQDFELHVAQFAVAIGEQDQIPDFDQLSLTDRRAKVLEIRQQKLAKAADAKARASLKRKFSRTDPFIHLTRLQRSRLLEDALDLVGGHDGLVLFGDAISKSHHAVTSQRVDPVKQAFEQMVGTFNAFLGRHHRWQQRFSKPKINKGLLVMDRDYGSEATIERQFKDYRSLGHPWGELGHVIEVPFFASSEKLAGLQIVDACSYAVRRYLDTGAVVGSHEERNFLRIFHKFDRASGRLHGLRHYVPSGTCKCLICQERGHGIESAQPGPVTPGGRPLEPPGSPANPPTCPQE